MRCSLFEGSFCLSPASLFLFWETQLFAQRPVSFQLSWSTVLPKFYSVLVNASYPFPKLWSFQPNQGVITCFVHRFWAKQRGYRGLALTLDFFFPMHLFFFCCHLWFLSIVWKRSPFRCVLALLKTLDELAEKPILEIGTSTSQDPWGRFIKCRKPSFEWILSNFGWSCALAQRRSPRRWGANELRVLACRAPVSLGRLAVDQPCSFKNFSVQK